MALIGLVAIAWIPRLGRTPDPPPQIRAIDWSPVWHRVCEPSHTGRDAMKAKKSKGKPAAHRAAKDFAPKKSRAVKGGSIKQEPGGSAYEGSPVATYSIVNAWPKK
jgi:hypothetical protein